MDSVIIKQVWKYKNLLFISLISLVLLGCAAHPTISPIALEPGETYTAVTFSMENVFPMFVYRRGLTEISDIGVRIGLPIYGSGIDYSRRVFEHENSYDLLNMGFSFTPNSSFDLTYYTIRTFPKKPGNAFYTGFRGMFIPNGISDSESFRIGLLTGLYINRIWGVELGYFHDFDRGQPIENLFDMEPKNDPKYPAITDFGLPSEYSRLVGLSFQITLSTEVFSRKDKEKK